MKPIRNSAKAIIMNNERLLLTKNKDDLGFFYLFPGGGQEHGEQLREAVARECIEEIGQQVEVGDLVYVREYIGKNHQFADSDSEIHQVEFYFQCSLVSNDSTIVNGANPDEYQVGVEWIDIDHLEQFRIYPATLGPLIKNKQLDFRYLGDAN